MHHSLDKLAAASIDPPNNQKRQMGVALVTAIFVVALATIAAVSMFDGVIIAMHRTNNLQGSEQAEWYALSAESWVCSLLQRESVSQRQRGYISLGDPWARSITGFPMDRGVADIKLEDLQGRFNINNLGALNPTPYMEQFQRLMGSIPDIQNSDAGTLAADIRDWIDFDSEPWAGVGAEDIYYMSLHPPYRASNRLMRSPSELLSVRGVTPQLYEAIHPYITTLPTTSAKVNINTAPLPVLESLSSESAAFTQFIAERSTNPASSVQQAVARGALPKDPTLNTFADVSSNYFQLKTMIAVDGVQIVLYSTIIWPINGSPTVLLHSLATD